MKIGISVAIALFVSFFLIISIFFINFVKAPVFLFIYFIFVLLWLSLVGYGLKKKFPEEMTLVFLAVIIIFVAVAITFFGNSVKMYYDKNTEFLKTNQALSDQLDNITRTNEYYHSYINFINDEIVKTQQARFDLQVQLNELIEKQRLAAIAARKEATRDDEPASTSQAQNNTPIIIREGDEEEEDD